MLPKPGVMDPVAQSALAAIADLELPAEAVRTLRKYWLAGPARRSAAAAVLEGAGQRRHRAGDRRAADASTGWKSARPTSFSWSPCRSATLDDAALERLSREGQLYLSLVEMQTIQAHFRTLGRDPTDVELETVAQTWSEHCSHKTLAGRIPYRDARRRAAFREHAQGDDLRRHAARFAKTLGADDWCVSVFADNAGVIRFDDAVQRRLQGRDAQPPLGPRALRRRQHGHRRRDPRPAGHRPGRQADLQHRRLLLRPARHARPNRCRPACCIRAA